MAPPLELGIAHGPDAPAPEPTAGRWGRMSLGTRVKAAARAAVGIFSDQSLTQAFGLLGGVLPGGMGSPPTRGTAEYLRAYSEMPWLRALASRVATAVARADWQLMVVGKPNEKARRDGVVQRIQRGSRPERVALLKQLAAKQELRQIEEHPLLDVLTNANSFQTGLGMRKVTQLHLDLTGDAFWLKERDGQGTPVGVWPVPPHWIMATPTPTFRFFRVSFKAWRGLIPDTEFIWFSDDDPLNPYGRGSGIARALADELETDEYAAKHTKAFFYNQARPDLLVWPKGGNMRPENVARLEEDWLSKTQGFWRAFKPYFLSREVEVKELEMNFRSLQLVQVREHERNTIMQVFGVPPEILGVLEHSNRSTIDAASYLMAKFVTEPRLEFMRSVLQERFVPEYDERLIIEYASPVQDDQGQQLAAATVAPWALSLDEWRKLAGQPAMEDEDAGAMHMIPGTVKPTSVEEIVNPPEPPPSPFGLLGPDGQPLPPKPGGFPGQPPPKPGEKPDDKPKPKPGEEVAPPPKRGIDLAGHILRGTVAEDVDVALSAGDVGLAERLRKHAGTDDDERLPAPSQAAARYEPSLARTLVRGWRDHAARVDRRALVAALGPQGVPGDVVTLLNPAGLGAAQTAAVVPQLTRAFLKGANVGASALRRRGVAVRTVVGLRTKPGSLVLDLAALNPQAAAWAEAHAGELVSATSEVQAAVRALIARYLHEEITQDELASLLLNGVGLLPRQLDAVANFRDRLAADPGVTDEARETRVARYALAQGRARAQGIARTELIGALNKGQQALWDEAVTHGVIESAQFEQVWIVTDDDALDAEVCEPLADQRAALGGLFPGGYDGPPAHPNCRCAVGLVNADDFEAAVTAPVVAQAAPAMPAIHIHIDQSSRKVRQVLRDGAGNITGITEDVLVEVPKYSPDQPRDDQGQFGSGGGGTGDSGGHGGGGGGGSSDSGTGGGHSAPHLPHDISTPAGRHAVLGQPASAYPHASPHASDSDGQHRDQHGAYTPERQQLHAAIVAEHFAGATPATGQPTLTMLGGGPASGKSEVLLKQLKLGKAVAIDSDHVKTKLPEYREHLSGGGPKARAAAAFVHEESSAVSKALAQHAAAGHYDTLLDGTGDNSLENLQKKVAGFRKAGHAVHAEYVTVDVDKAIAFANKRGARTGRYVPETFLRETHASVSRVFPKAVAAGLFDKATLWDNNGGHPRKIMTARGKKITIHDQAAWDRFKAKGQ